MQRPEVFVVNQPNMGRGCLACCGDPGRRCLIWQNGAALDREISQDLERVDGNLRPLCCLTRGGCLIRAPRRASLWKRSVFDDGRRPRHGGGACGEAAGFEFMAQ